MKAHKDITKPHPVLVKHAGVIKLCRSTSSFDISCSSLTTLFEKSSISKGSRSIVSSKDLLNSTHWAFCPLLRFITLMRTLVASEKWPLLDLMSSPESNDSFRNRLEYLTATEAEKILDQFTKTTFRPGGQVMCTGIPREWAQSWADKNSVQTLTTVMGPLMNREHPSCLRSTKSAKEWSTYVKGASELYALYIPKGNVITVLTRPPPQRLNPTGISTYQTIEEPILTGRDGGESVSRVEMVHLTVAGAQQFRYEVWPTDKIHEWIQRFDLHPLVKPGSPIPKERIQEATNLALSLRANVQGKSRQERGARTGSMEENVDQGTRKQEEAGIGKAGQETNRLENIEQKIAIWTKAVHEKAVQKKTKEVETATKESINKAERERRSPKIEPMEKSITQQQVEKEQAIRQKLAKEEKLEKKSARFEEIVAQTLPSPNEIPKLKRVRTLRLRSRVIICEYET